MGLGPTERHRVRTVIAKSTIPMSPRNIAVCTGFDRLQIRDFLRNERKKARRKQAVKPPKIKTSEHQLRQRKRVRGREETRQEIIARMLADCPPDRDPAEHERIVLANFGKPVEV